MSEKSYVAAREALIATAALDRLCTRIVEAETLIAELSADLSDEGCDRTVEGLAKLRARVADFLLPSGDAPDWLKAYRSQRTEIACSIEPVPAAPAPNNPQPAPTSAGAPPVSHRTGQERRRPLIVGGRIMHMDGVKQGRVTEIDGTDVLVAWEHGPNYWIPAGFLQAMPEERLAP